MTDTSAPCQTLGTEPSFGFGDRIGLATPGHVLAMQRSGHGILPIFPQQSIREMARTNRSPSTPRITSTRRPTVTTREL